MSVRASLALRTRINSVVEAGLRRRYTFVGDGIATSHLCGFEHDDVFQQSWPIIENHWRPGIDVRWRVWIMRRFAEQASRLSGGFAEFGTYRGGCASAVLAAGVLPPNRPFFLFDTFSGIPSGSVLPGEPLRFFGEFSNSSPEYAMRLLGRWDRNNVQMIVGDVNETLKEFETGPLAFVHLDLNASQPSKVAMEYVWPRLVTGGVIVFDDYGWDDYVSQRLVIDAFCADNAAPVVQFPTGTAMTTKA